MFAAFSNVVKIPELKRRVIFTFLLLAVYRIGSHVPTPGIDGSAIAEFFKGQAGGIFGLFAANEALRMLLGDLFPEPNPR